MPERKPQINFQVDTALKLLYEEAKASGHLVTRFCAAGFLLLVEDPQIRVRAINRLRDWEEEYDQASAEEIRAFVEGVQGVLRGGARGNQRGRSAPKMRKKAKRSES